ncbi:MAG: hypothetical protein AAF467_02550 [Actinomycetota bacterium]
MLVGLALLASITASVEAEPSGAAVQAPAPGDIAAVQRTDWGLATFGQARSVARFSALGWAVEEVDGVVYAGGNFLDVTNGARTERQPYLAGFAVGTGVWNESFRPTVGGPVLALEAAPDGGLFVGGEMDEWNGETIGALAKIDPATGQLWPGWRTRVYGGTSVVRDISLGPDGWLYVAGTFTTASDAGDPRTVYNVIRLDPDTGAIDWSWLPQTQGGAVWGVSASHIRPTVYLAGWNNVMAGQQVIGVDAADGNRVTWSTFEANFPCCDHMYDVQATPFGTVAVAGEQHGFYVFDENQNMRLLAAHVTSFDSRFQASNVRRGGDYQDIELAGDVFYASCHCWGSHTTALGFLNTYSGDLARVAGTHTGSVSSTIAYDARTGVRDQSFNPYMAGDIGGWGVLVASDGCVWIAGGINAVGPPGQQRPGRDLARLCAEGFDPGVDLAAPATCRAQVAPDLVTVTWDGVDGATDYVISRSVDGGRVFWRGRSVERTFVDTSRTGDLVYTVGGRDANQRLGPVTQCATQIVNRPVDPVSAPTGCVARIQGDAVAVSWNAVAEAASYVVYRSVDGGTDHWRGVSDTTSFTDTSRRGTLEYAVAAKAADRRRSDRAACVTEVVPEPDPEPIPEVAACAVTQGGGPNQISVTWDRVDDANAAYVIYRSVDDSQPFWRGRVDGTSFDDTLRTGAIEYFVAVKIDDERSERTACTPRVRGQ